MLMTSAKTVKVAWQKNTTFIYFLYFLVLFIAYSPTYLFSYAFSDDWALFYAAAHNLDIFRWDIISGRALYGLLKLISTGVLQSVSGFQIIRLVGVLTLWLLCCYLYKFITSRSLITGRYEAIIFPVLLCLLPAFQVYTAWAICSPFIISVLLSGLSYHTLTRTNTPHLSPWRFIVALVFLCLSFAIYQPSAMSFLFFVFLDNCITDKALSFKKLFICALVISLGVLCSLALSKFIPNTLYHESFSRTEFTQNIAEKIRWFFHKPLINAICNFNLKTKPVYTFISMALIAIGLYSVYKQKHGVRKIGLILLLAIACYAPNLAVKESWPAYRTLITLELIISSVFMLGIFSVANRLSLQRYLYPIIIATCGYLAFSHVLTGFALPQRLELQALSTKIRDTVPTDFDGKLMFAINGPKHYAFSRWHKYDEFGLTSMMVSWAVPGMAESIKTRLGMHYQVSENSIISKDNPCDTHCIVIDTGALANHYASILGR